MGIVCFPFMVLIVYVFYLALGPQKFFTEVVEPVLFSIGFVLLFFSTGFVLLWKMIERTGKERNIKKVLVRGDLEKMRKCLQKIIVMDKETEPKLVGELRRELERRGCVCSRIDEDRYYQTVNAMNEGIHCSLNDVGSEHVPDHGPFDGYLSDGTLSQSSSTTIYSKWHHYTVRLPEHSA